MKGAVRFGALWFLGWYLAGLLAYGGFEVMGETDETLQRFVASNYLWFTVGLQGALAAVALLLGGIVGGLAGLFARRIGRPRFAYGVVLFVWFAVQFRQIVAHPQFLDGPFLDGKPWLASIVFAPTGWGERGMTLSVGLLAAALSLLLYAPLRHLVGLRWGRIALAGGVGVYLFGLAVEQGGATNFFYGAPQKERPSILLLAIDSLRPDHLSVSGYSRPTTPAIDQLAREGVFFERMVVDVPRTFPSWVTMMTGRYSFDHGVRHMFPTAEQRALVWPTLPRRLRGEGYQTAVISDFAGDIFPRIDFGFERVVAPDLTFDIVVAMRNLEMHPTLLAFLNNPLGKRLFPAIRELVYNSDPDEMTGEAADHLRRLDRSRPFLLALFYSASHLPYAVPGPWYGRFADPAYDGPHRFQRKNMLMREGESPEDLQQIVALYDGGLAAIDASVARLLNDLFDLGFADNTIVVVTGDHGEAFYEHGADIGHGNHLQGAYAQTVPLIVYDPRPGAPRGRTALQIRSIDLAPTLAALADVPFAEAAGRSAIPLVSGEEKEHRSAYSESGLWYLPDGPFFYQKVRLHYPGITQLCEVDAEYRNEIVMKEKYQGLTVAAKHRALSDGRWKLIVMPTADRVVEELYDQQADPEEKRDVAVAHPDIVARLRHEMEFLVNASREDRMTDGRPVNIGSARP
ncbi:MAG: sulfatase-like hydrolase/transferase [Nitrospinae bacterium]|nr:sulfatase-like hydrolase/transferase [Nitrospinota bacterium]